MNYSIFDIETTSTIDKIHCLVASVYRDNVLVKKFWTTNYEEIKEFVLGEECLVGHKIITFDIPVLERLLGIKITARLIDTLGLSWYLYPNRARHGLEWWGEDLGVEKPKVGDWEGLDIEVYVNRCIEDVKINTLLFDLQIRHLMRLYDGDGDAIKRIIGYITFKLDCAAEQEEVKWRLDKEKCIENLEILRKERKKKLEVLVDIMPHKKHYKVVARPKVYIKKDGELSVAAEKWQALLSDLGLPEYHNGALQILTGSENGNPNSYHQVKQWLFELGWKPDVFKYVRDDHTRKTRAIPQIAVLDGSDISDSIKVLYDKEPRLEHLEGLYILKHRIEILEGFLANERDGWLKAEISGLTNTLRFKHSIIVNLPGVNKPYGVMIRGVLIAPDDDHILCGADVSGLEEGTKHHFMSFFDPEYVKKIRQPGYDPHLDLAVLAGMLTEGEALDHKLGIRKQTVIRDKAKKTNFAAIYLAQPPKIAETAGITLEEAKVLYDAYWELNKSIRQVANACVTKMVDGQRWLWNPVSRFWYSLRAEKDKFSTLNQGTGAYCFDTWVRKVRGRGFRLCGQFHDELATPIWKLDEWTTKIGLEQAMNENNDELQLNIKLGISVAFGRSYADIH